MERITKTYAVQSSLEAAAICSMIDNEFGSTWFTNRETDVLVHVLDKYEDQLDKEVTLWLARTRCPRPTDRTTSFPEGFGTATLAIGWVVIVLSLFA